MRKGKFTRYLTDVACYGVGAVFYAAAICCFVRPNGLVTGGFSGLSIILNKLFGVPLGVSVFALNIPLFLLGFKKIGKTFVLRSVLATAAVSAMLDFAAPLFPKVQSESILAAIAGGILAGSGLALIFVRGGSTGGADIIGKLVNLKYPHLPLGRVIMAVDIAVITLFAVLFGNITAALYSALMIGISSAAVDYFIYGAKSGKILLTVTDKGTQVAQTVNRLGARGATIVPAVGAYTGQERSVLVIAVKNHEIGKMYKLIYQLDPAAFITLLDARQITGLGFEKYE